MNGTQGEGGAGSATATTEATTAAAPENPQGITPAAPAASAAAAPAAIDASTLATFRAAIVAANPDAIPELIAGDSFEAITASVAGAKTAYANAAARIKPEGQAATAPSVPAGGGAAPVVNLAQMSPAAKIAHGLSARRKAG